MGVVFAPAAKGVLRLWGRLGSRERGKRYPAAPAAARRVLHAAVNCVSDEPERAFAALRDFERLNGDLASFDAAEERIAAQAGRVAERRSAAASKAAAAEEAAAAEREAEHGDDGGGRVVRTSALTGAGVDELIGALENALREYPFPRHRAS